MRVINFFKSLFTSTCVWFTFVTLFMFLMGAEVKGDGAGISLAILGWFLFYSFLMSLLGMLFKIKKLSLALKVVFHFIGSVSIFSVVFFLLSGIYKTYNFTGNTAIVLTTVFVICYVVIACVALLFRFFVRKVTKETDKYENVYNK